MIERMKFVNIIGPIKDFERAKEVYLTECEIQIEDAVSELADDNEVSAFSLVNAYSEPLKKAEHFANIARIESAEESHLSTAEAVSIVGDIDKMLEDSAAKINDLSARKKECEDFITQITPFSDMEIPIDKLMEFKFLKFRFGRIPVNGYKQLENYLYEQNGVFFENANTDKDFVYCVYFVPETISEKVDAIIESLSFERIEVTDEFKGSPVEVQKYFKENLDKSAEEIKELEGEQAKQLMTRANDLSFSLRKLKELSSYVEMQRFAAKTTNDEFYVLVGWMPESDAFKLARRTESDESVVVILEDTSEELKTTPPTKLKNSKLLQPFEFLVKMYGLPHYKELDPTFFFGISYAILFGMMFGDLGQGMVLAFAGYYVYQVYKFKLAAVITIAGISSSFFGIMYGSVFGYEDRFFTHLWVSPMHDMNVVLITTIGFGILLNMIAMLFHIINGVRMKNWGTVLFDPNGVSGLVFYIQVLFIGLSIYSGNTQAAYGVAFSLMVIPFLMIMFKEPLTAKLEGHEKLIPGTMGDYLLSLFFETFEVLLTYLTNTISFIRVGAFALCHVGMMSVVLMLANTTETYLGNPVVLVIGNLFVMLMEGLVVGIQALRLQFYEMFSRYFVGGGREFRSFKKQYRL